MTDAGHAFTRDRLEEYALDILSPRERAQVELHLAECATCASEARELQLVLQALPYELRQVDVPPHVRQRVLEGFAAERKHASPHQSASPLRSASRRWLLAAAAVLVASTLVTWRAVMLRDEARREQAASDATVRQLQERLQSVALQADRVVAILTANDLSTVTLAAPDRRSGGTARAYWSTSRGLLVVADDLPEPPAGRVYQVWLVPNGGAPISAGLIQSEGTRRGLLVAAPPPGAEARTMTIAVTDEPPGGLAAPTGSMRLVGSS